MVLRRLGNKAKLAEELEKHFPPHSIYIELFFGAGGMFFNKKKKAKYNFLNDIDSDVINLFNVVTERAEEFEEFFSLVPICENLWNYWKENEETEPIRKAARFLLLSNFGYMGQAGTLRLVDRQSKKQAINKISLAKRFLKNNSCYFLNKDFLLALKSIIPIKNEPKKCFIYADPPYLKTGDNYKDSFVKKDFTELLEALIATKCNFAVSEFNNDFVLSEAARFGLNVIKIKKRQTLGNRNIEILITNYQKQQITIF